MKRLLTALLVFFTTLSVLPATAASQFDEQFVATPPTFTERGTGIYVNDAAALQSEFSRLEAWTADGKEKQKSKPLQHWICTEYGKGDCTQEKYVDFTSVLGLCNAQVTTDCVKSVTAVGPDGKLVTGTLVEEFPGKTQFSFPGNVAAYLPAGSSAFIVDFPTLPHAGGTQYIVIAALSGYKQFDENVFKIDGFKAGIYAIKRLTTNPSPLNPMSTPAPEPGIPPSTLLGGGGTLGYFGYSTVNGRPTPSACIQNTLTDCALPYPLPTDVNFSLNLKLHSKVSGWLNGRIDDVQAIISADTDGDQLVSVSGKPLVIPTLFKWLKKSELTPEITAFYGNDVRNRDFSGNGYPGLVNGQVIPRGDDEAPYSILKTRLSYDEQTFKEVIAWLSAMNNTATGTPTAWSFRSVQMNDDIFFSRCLSQLNSLAGIVTTNATMYVASPPTFNQTDQSLEYKVAAAHNLPDGTEFRGRYNLLIRSEFARCIYNYTTAPVSASVSIVSADGGNQVATTSFGEKDGWLKFSANNFTFSAPTIRVKLTQAKVEPVVTPVTPAAPVAPAPQVIPQVAKTKNITCVKGKTIKKVLGSNPKCPVGYKLK